MIILTKDQILRGVKYTEDFPVEELGGAVRIRALSDGELTAIEAEHMKRIGDAGVSFSGEEKQKLTIPQTAAVNESTSERIWTIAAKAMSVDNGEAWTWQEVSKLPPEAVGKIYERVLGISQGSIEKVRSFRANKPWEKAYNLTQAGV